MRHCITVLPQNQNIDVPAGITVQSALQSAGIMSDAPCGGNGTCGKCRVVIDGKQMLACQTIVDRDMTVTLPQNNTSVILADGTASTLISEKGLCLALDIGTTTVVGYLMENGNVLATEGRKNPQSSFGADVVSRINHATNGHTDALTAAIRKCVKNITSSLLQKAHKHRLDRICIVGNPAMEQLFLGLPVDNLNKPPFEPVLTTTQVMDGGEYIPEWNGAKLLVVPNISGYIGADTVACILATGIDKSKELALLVDIGTNGEMVLGNQDHLVACATAAGPAMEGTGIKFGMQAQTGAIDRVTGDFDCHVISDETACGICGSGLLDAVAIALDKGLINSRGRILTKEHTLPLTDGISLTQEDIRQLQQAKGAIAAGIQLMMEHLNVTVQDIDVVYLAGAFGSFMDQHSACRIGLLPAELENKIRPIGNAAGSGAKQMACNQDIFVQSNAIVSSVEHLQLATLPHWARYFAKCMYFDTPAEYWCKKALSLGFSHAVPLDTGKLIPREDVRAMCANDKCGAYGKNWTCPPHCGTLADCATKMGGFAQGILVQTVGTMNKTIDSKAYRETETRHLKQFHALADSIKTPYPDALCLASGGCRICKNVHFRSPAFFPKKPIHLWKVTAYL